MPRAAKERRPLVSYQLIIHLPRAVRVLVGRLGAQRFPAGRYVYTGSARRGMEARIARHMAQAKRPHWHIDYLLAATGVQIVNVRRRALPECQLNQRTRGTVPVPGFGASDCRAGCGSHLKHQGGSRSVPGSKFG